VLLKSVYTFPPFSIFFTFGRFPKTCESLETGCAGIIKVFPAVRLSFEKVWSLLPVDLGPQVSGNSAVAVVLVLSREKVWLLSLLIWGPRSQGIPL
jgi:hypothetical protein